MRTLASGHPEFYLEGPCSSALPPSSLKLKLQLEAAPRQMRDWRKEGDETRAGDTFRELGNRRKDSLEGRLCQRLPASGPLKREKRVKVKQKMVTDSQVPFS